MDGAVALRVGVTDGTRGHFRDFERDLGLLGVAAGAWPSPF